MTVEENGSVRAGTRNANRLLVVEDDQAIGDLIRAVLIGEGFEAVLARDTQQAMAVIRERVPDLILLDVHLADGEPIEALVPRIRGSAAREIPLVIMSATHEARHAAALGACGFVPKPFELETLIQEVQLGLGSHDRSEMGMLLASDAGVV